MPTVEADTVSHVENTLKAYLKGGSQSSDLTNTITSSVKKALLENVEFTPAVKPASLQVENLRTKYISLNPSGASPGGGLSNGNHHNGANNSNGVNRKVGQDEMPQPKVVLYPPQKVQLHWASPRRIGPGIQNMGNTCFLNSVLQCLTYTAPFSNFILSGEHKNKCRQVGFCAFCEIGNHISRALTGHENVIRPMVILKNLRYIAKDMSWGKQEDSHEFLRLVLDHIQKSCYKGIPNLDSLSKETTIVNQIFGGFLRSQVLCLKCKHRSSIYEPFLDLSLDIKNVTHIEKALERFVQPDHLEGKNAYKCSNCKNSVQAQKRFTIHRAPNVLTLQLKRFQFGGSIFGGSGKMTKHVAFPTKVNLRSYMSAPKGDPVTYHLYGVICHSGYSCNSGHYFAYVNAPNKAWYVMNDSQVNQVQIGRVLSAEAYMLFYLKATPSHLTTPSKQTAKIGPQLPPGRPTPAAVGNNVQKSPGNKSDNSVIGPALKRPVSSTAPNDKKISPLTQGSKIPPASQRERVSFGIKLPNQQAQQQPKPQQEGTNQPGKPRIVMHIKSGKVVSISPTKAERTSAAKPAVTSPSKLVPYGDESDSDEDSGTPLKAQNKKNGEAQSKESNSAVKTGATPDAMKNIDESVKKSPTSNLPKSKEIHTDRVLTTPPKRLGTLRRSLSADGPLTVNTNIQYKLNATPGPWQVTDNSVAQSPSLASECSNSSINSTTEWNVMDSKEAPKTPVIPEAQCPGWTVTPKGANNRSAINSGTDKNLPRAENSNTNNGESKDGFRKEKTTPLKPQGHVALGDNMFQKRPLSDLTLFSALKNRSSSPEKRKPEGNGLKDTVNGTRDGKVENNFTGADHDNEQSNSKREQLIKQSVDDHDEHKKQGEFNGGESLVLERHKKKKKRKKHKKHKHEDREPLLGSSDSESDRDSAKRHSKKKRRYSRSEDDDDEQSTGFVWVEKTKESLQDDDVISSKKCKLDSSHGDGRHVETKVWDSKEGYKNRKHDSNGDSSFDKKHKTSYAFDRQRAWDGSKSSYSVVKELKGNSIFGFGDKVMSWEGGRSAIDEEVERDRMIERKRRMEDYDTYEEELDSGRVKKVKRRSDDYSHKPHGNPFQRYQDDKCHGNKSYGGRDRWRSGPSSGGYHGDRYQGYGNNSHRSYDRPRHHSHHGNGDYRGGDGYRKYRNY